MARIRSIKPDYFTHPSIMVLSLPARLLFISLWTQADDEGRLYDQASRIRGLAFDEQDKVNIGALLDELASNGRIVRYEALGRGCIEIVDFHQHQRINRPSPSQIPPPGLFSDPSPNGQAVLPEPPIGKPGAVPDGLFDEFWEVFPSSRDRKAAERAFAKAIKRAAPGVIIAGAQRYRDDPHRDPTKTKYAAGWLNGDRWEDDYSTVAAKSSVPEPDSGLDDSWLNPEES
jgi:hypothetical protein